MRLIVHKDNNHSLQSSQRELLQISETSHKSWNTSASCTGVWRSSLLLLQNHLHCKFCPLRIHKNVYNQTFTDLEEDSSVANFSIANIKPLSWITC